MKKNRTFNSLKPIRTLLPENVKKLIKNKPITDFDSLRNSWNRVLGEETAKKCQLIKIEKIIILNIFLIIIVDLY